MIQRITAERVDWKPSGKNQRVTPDSFRDAERITGDVIIQDAQGVPIAAMISVTERSGPLVATLGRLLRRTEVPWTDIGSRLGSARLSGIKYPNVTFGTVAPAPLRRRYGCRFASLHADRPEVVGLLADIYSDAWEQFKNILPAVAHETSTTAELAIHDDWRFCGTPWTSGIINHTAALPYHRDSGNLPGTWSAMVMCKRGCTGGELHLPEYNLLLDVPDKSLCLFDGQSAWHGVTPFTLRNSESYRFSTVMYSKQACRDCGPEHEEAARAARVATQHDYERQTVLATNRAAPVPTAVEPAAAAIAETHMQFLADFTRYERAVGGPDPHMRIVCEGLIDPAWSPEERAWMVGCYLGPYNVPSGEVIKHYWPTASAALNNAAGFRDWISKEWRKLSLRRERRAIRTPIKFADHMLDYASWCMERAAAVTAETDAERVWKELIGIKGNGRYATIKTYEALHRCNVVTPPFPDIRPHGGWSPREMLARLHPDVADALNGGNTAALCNLANERAEVSKRDLERTLAETVDWYTMEVVLCEYKQAWDGGQYPGRAHDSELGHVSKVTPHWPEVDFRTLAVRKDLFPHFALGELNGWDGRREGLGGCPSEYGYMWTDTLYVYSPEINLANPSRRLEQAT